MPGVVSHSTDKEGSDLVNYLLVLALSHPQALQQSIFRLYCGVQSDNRAPLKWTYEARVGVGTDVLHRHMHRGIPRSLKEVNVWIWGSHSLEPPFSLFQKGSPELAEGDSAATNQLLVYHLIHISCTLLGTFQCWCGFSGGMLHLKLFLCLIPYKRRF